MYGMARYGRVYSIPEKMIIFLFFDCEWAWGCVAGAAGFMFALVMLTRVQGLLGATAEREYTTI